MLEFLRRRWFLVSLVGLIAAGLVGGSFGDGGTVERFRQFVPARPLTAFVLLMMAFSLNSQQLRESFRSPAPVLWASLTNFGLLPLLGMLAVPYQLTPDFRIGLMIAVSTPCTLAAASVWTRKAGGNDAVSLLTTLLTNTFCFVLTPLWLTFGTAKSVELSLPDLVQRLVIVVLLPTLLGQLLRLNGRAAAFATRYKTPIGMVAQSCILLLVFLSALGGGVQLRGADLGTRIAALLLVWGTCIALHLTVLGVAWWGGGVFGFSRRDRIAAAFAGSQKTLPIGVYLATDPSTFGGPDVIDGMPVPFAVFPMILFHASQLFIDTLVADRWARAGDSGQVPVASRSTSTG